jgi:hypothetical protein
VLLLLAEALHAEDVVQVLRACARSQGAWCPALVEADPSGLRALPLTPCRRYELEEIALCCSTGEGALFLRVDDVVERTRAVVHDINNPLGAALVEVQMQLLDAADDETRRVFGTLQDQLRLIKKMLAKLAFPGVRRARHVAAAQDG